VTQLQYTGNINVKYPIRICNDSLYAYYLLYFNIPPIGAKNITIYLKCSFEIDRETHWFLKQVDVEQRMLNFFAVPTSKKINIV